MGVSLSWSHMWIVEPKHAGVVWIAKHARVNVTLTVLRLSNMRMQMQELSKISGGHGDLEQMRGSSARAVAMRTVELSKIKDVGLSVGKFKVPRLTFIRVRV